MNKYRKIIFLILSIILFNAGVALASYYISQNVSKYNAYGTALSQQQVYLDKLSKDIIDINIFTERLQQDKDPQALNHFFEETYNQVEDVNNFYRHLKTSIENFSHGEALNINNTFYILPKPAGRAAVLDQRINEIWQPLSVLVNKIIEEIKGGNLEELGSNIQFSADYIRKYSEILGGYLGQLKDFYLEKANKDALWLKYLQIFAIAFTVIFFGFLTYFGLRSLVYSDSKLEKAQKETTDIMKTVKEGLFLVDEALVISEQYSKNLEAILDQKQIGGQKLDHLLSSIVSQKDFETTKDFIEQLFNDEVIEELIEELNPLDKIKIFIQKDSKIEDKYLSFNFSRVYDGEKITNVLISVADITRQVMLEEKLEKERVQHDKQIEMLSSILSVPAVILQSFIRHVSGACNTINNILRSSTNLTKTQLTKKLEQIFREVHAIKGEASALNFDSFVSLAEDMETKIAKLKQKPDISGRDFLALTIDLDRLLDLNHKIIELQKKMAGDDVKPIESVSLTSDKTHAEIKQLQNLVSEVAKRNHKEVKFLVRGWHFVQQLEEWQQDKLREVIIQLLRNAVVHGIEPANLRETAHKNTVGRVLCEIIEHEGYLVINIADDGGGIDFQTLQKKAITAGKLSADLPLEQAKPLLLRYLFNSGVSTAKVNNEDAGRGVGMDIVKARLKELSAKMMLNTEKGKMTQFKMKVPI